MYLRCAAGSVEWLYPTGALIVNVRPNTSPSSQHLTLCIKPLRGSSGANIYLERTGELKLLLRDGEHGPGQVSCFGFEHGGLFVEAAPQPDISRRTTGFQYELSGRPAGSHLLTLSGGWRALRGDGGGARVGVGCAAPRSFAGTASEPRPLAAGRTDWAPLLRCWCCDGNWVTRPFSRRVARPSGFDVTPLARRVWGRSQD